KINEVLSGDAQQNALEFISFLRANDILLEANSEGEGWAVGGVVGNSMGYMIVNGVAKELWLWFNDCDFETGVPVDDELKEFTWAHVSPCGHCHEGWKTCGGGNRTIFGREFEWLCHSPMMFTNFEADKLENIKKLMLILKQKWGV
ncbi:MAG: hypothetical protein FWF15_08015, partial [Oscillospiraceae bacterium]|nr:hypothetical protein [Oscillospiraceae bacterium]